jgi:hypothetical protein
LLATVAGIEPSAPGFREVVIEPHLGPLTRVDASMPHPLGDVTVSYRREGGLLKAHVELPPGLAGTFIWKGEKTALHPGSQQLELTTQTAVAVR